VGVNKFDPFRTHLRRSPTFLLSRYHFLPIKHYSVSCWVSSFFIL
jgi:hypothetical protein